MNLANILFVMLFTVPLSSLKNEKFEKRIQYIPRIAKEQVGVINTPLPDRRGFQIPGQWTAVKMIDEKAVYLVKNGRRYLVPNYADPSRSTYLLWTTIGGEEPEIIIWPCPNDTARASRIGDLERKNQERRNKAVQHRKKAEEARQRRGKERQMRTAARREKRARLHQRPGRRFAASQEHHQQLLGMQRPLADAVVDRVTKAMEKNAARSGMVSTFAADDESMLDIRQNVLAAMAIQLQIRDIQWCEALQKHLAPNMFDTVVAGSDILKDSDPENVAAWLSREVERQNQRAEAQVDFEQDSRAETQIMRVEMGEDKD